MKKIFFLLIFLFFAFSFLLIFNSKSFLVSRNVFLENIFLKNVFSKTNKDISLLILGKPGPGYIGSENTDSIVVAYYNFDKNTLFLIPIPRDLVVYDENNKLKKINSLYGEKKISLLLKKVSEFTGLDIKNYFVVDLDLVTKLIDKIGGIEIYLDEPVIDAVTLYSIPAGKQNLNGYLVELVLRSRYHPEGDFFRIKNQLKILSALKDKIINSDLGQKLSLVQFLEENKYHWETNLTKKEFLSLFWKIKDQQKLKIIPIVIDLKTELLVSEYFPLENGEEMYGIYPRGGIDNFEKIKIYLWSKIKSS
jgi:LCP family protein required for cell wall assembly